MNIGKLLGGMGGKGGFGGGKDGGGGKGDLDGMLKMIGPMLDQIIIGVPLEKFEEIKLKNPEAKVVPLMTYEQIKYDETKLMLGLSNMFIGDLGTRIDNQTKSGLLKVISGFAYKMDTDEGTRNRFMTYMNRIVEFKGKVM